MQLSIVIPTLDEADNIEHAVQSAWELSPCEVIVADGGSEDGTREIAGQAGATVVCSRPGRGWQQNAGARESSGNVLLFLHADSWLPAAAKEQMGQALENPATPGGAFRQRIDAPGFLFRALEWGNSQRVLQRRIAYGDQGIFLRRSTFESVGGFPNLRLMEDLRLSRQVRKLGRLALLPGPLHVSARRWKQRGVIRQTARNWLLVTAERFGVSPDRLADYYANHRD
jgi:rSAM/selenodomain-associated transferase 2